MFSANIPNAKFWDEKNCNENIEAKGVAPDILVAADSAYLLAYNLALNGKHGDGDVKFFGKQHDKKSDEISLIKNSTEYVGDYNKIKVLKEEEALFLIYDDIIKSNMLSISRDEFTDEDNAVIRFIRTKQVR